MGVNGRAKGSNYERKIAKVFSKWWGSDFCRIPLSGGHEGLKGWNICGDIATPDKTFPFSVELKNRQSTPHLHAFLTEKGLETVKSWWNQCVGDCPAGKLPLLVFTKNYMPSMAVTLYQPDFLEMGGELSHFIFRWSPEGQDMIMMTLDSFLGLGKDFWLQLDLGD